MENCKINENIIYIFFFYLERPEILKDMEKKPVELLNRLTIVKVTSESAPQVIFFY